VGSGGGGRTIPSPAYGSRAESVKVNVQNWLGIRSEQPMACGDFEEAPTDIFAHDASQTGFLMELEAPETEPMW